MPESSTPRITDLRVVPVAGRDSMLLNLSGAHGPFFTRNILILTDSAGHYSFTTIKPGAYPWGNHHNAWRPAHIHFSVFGHSFVSRLVTQMYFPGDPLFPFDPIFNSVTDEKARDRMVSSFDLDSTKPDWALCYRFNIVLRGRNATPMETK